MFPTWIRTLLTAQTTPAPAGRRKPRFRPGFDTLEGRFVPAPVVLGSATLTGAAGNSQWFFDNTEGTSNGQAVGGTCDSSPGMAASDASFMGQGDAYDGGLLIFVDNVQFTIANVDATPNTLTAGPVNLSGLNVSEQFFAANTTGTIRQLVTFTNPTNAAITVTVDWANNVGSDGGTVIATTSSGDANFTTADRWIVSDDGNANGGDPANTFVLAGVGGAVTPAAVATTVFDCAATNGVLATFTLTVQPGQTRSLLFFSQLNTSTANAVAAAPAFNTNPVIGGDLLTGLSGVQLSQIANWNFTLPTNFVTASQSGAFGQFLTLTGDNLANVVNVDRPNAFQIRVTPVLGTLLNGQANALTFTGVQNLSFFGNGGNDNINLDSSVTSLTLAGYLSINGGTGNNTVSTTASAATTLLVGGNLGIQNVNGTGTATLTNFQVNGNLAVNNGVGDSVTTLNRVDPTTFNTILGNLTITNGQGFDQNTIQNTDVTGSVGISNGAPNLLLGLDSTNIIQSLAAGPMFINGNLNVIAAATSNGANTVTITNVQVNGNTTIYGALAADTVTIRDATFRGTAVIFVGQGDDTVTLEDFGAVNGVTTFQKQVNVDLGFGNDNLNLGTNGSTVNFQSLVQFTGNFGFDTRTTGTANFLLPLAQSGFELFQAG